MISGTGAADRRLSFARDELDGLRRRGLYRSLSYGSVSGPYLTVDGKRLINLGSNDYLGIRSAWEAPSQMQSSARLIAGNDELYREAEVLLSELKSADASLVYPTGYMANLGILQVLAGRDDVILSDQLNHASLIQAAKLAGSRVRVYSHNDAADLERKIRVKARRRVVVTEGIFSMDGDYSRLAEIAEVAQRHDAILVVDDAHGDFVAGGGRGTAAHLGAKVDVHTSSLSKALGSFGGYVSSYSDVIDLCVNTSKAFMYTSALPGAVLGHALARLRMDLGQHRARLARNVKLLASGLEDLGLVSGPQTHIIPVVAGSAEAAAGMASLLRERGVFAVPIRYPTVAPGTERLRLSVTGWLEPDHIESALAAMEAAAARYGLT